MFEQDYIMRLIHDLARVLAKLLFQKDSSGVELAQDQEAQNALDDLLNLVDNGRIEEAENRIYELTADGNPAYLQTAFAFYSYLNDKEDTFLQEHHFSREEIKSGLEQLASRYGISGMSELFL